jgi:6-phosphofructokinase 1
VKRIAVLTSGGDCPGLNPCIRSVVRSALASGVDVLGVRRGWKGLLEDDTVEMDVRSVAGIVNRGGTILHSSRCPEFREEEQRARAAETLTRHEIDGLIVLGGNGTLQGAWALSQQTQLPIIGVPKTIDNDVGGTEYALGFDTAVNTAIEAIDKIRDTATSHERLFLVEVMGRDRGVLALEVALASGAEAVLMPETKTDIDALCQTLADAKSHGKKSTIVIVAEGDEAGGAYEIASKIKGCSVYEPRVSVLGYIQRGGAPSARDRVIGGLFGKAAVDALIAGDGGKLVALRAGNIELVDLAIAWNEAPPLDERRLELARVLAS